MSNLIIKSHQHHHFDPQGLLLILCMNIFLLNWWTYVVYILSRSFKGFTKTLKGGKLMNLQTFKSSLHHWIHSVRHTHNMQKY